MPGDDSQKNPMNSYTVRPLIDADQRWLPGFFQTHWGSTRQVTRGAVFVAHELPGFVAELHSGSHPEQSIDSEVVGLITYRFLDEYTGEVATLNSLSEGIGIGGTLLQAVVDVAQAKDCTRLIVVTTNDNLHALRFYQKQGFVLAELRANSLAQARYLKPEIPLVGRDGIPLRDEIELEMVFEE